MLEWKIGNQLTIMLKKLLGSKKKNISLMQVLI